MQEHFRRYLLVNIGAILASFLVFGAIFYFFTGALDAKVAKILANRTAIAQRSIDLESLNKLKTDTAAANDFQKKIDALLPPQDNLIGFPQFINTMARNHSLDATFGFDGGPVPPMPPAPGYVDFSMSLEGQPANIRSFLNDLENNTTKFMINVQRLTVTPRSGGWRADLGGQVYFQENKTAPT